MIRAKAREVLLLELLSRLLSKKTMFRDNLEEMQFQTLFQAVDLDLMVVQLAAKVPVT